MDRHHFFIFTFVNGYQQFEIELPACDVTGIMFKNDILLMNEKALNNIIKSILKYRYKYYYGFFAKKELL